MNTVPLVTGTSRSGTVSFFPDDTVEAVRQRVALASGSHPDRLFIEVKALLPADYYSSDPRRWTALFLRMSYDGRVVRPDELRVYSEQIRPGANVPLKRITLEEWETHEELEEIFQPKADFEEWRVLGVENSFVLPLPPKDLPLLKSTLVPLPQPTRIMENVHSYEITEIRSTPAVSPSQLVRMSYFPFLTDMTPANIENIRGPVEAAQSHIDKLLKLDTDPHDQVYVLRSKWYVPWVSTRFPSATVRFEQIFYGMTVNETVPYIGYFTGKDEVMRHKFYVQDPKTKKPFLDTAVWKSWLSTTQPQRRLPTLLFYRGKDRNTFDRISVTSKDVTISMFRAKGTKDGSPEELREWMNSFDALLPFVKLSDLEVPRWKLSDLSMVISYKKELKEIDRRRFACLQTVFSPQDASYQIFRFLRAENAQSSISPQELQAYQILNQAETPSPEVLESEMGLSPYEASRLFARVQDLSEDINLDQEVKGYPILTLGRSDITVTYVTNTERMIRYANLLRFVLDPSSESGELDAVCPRRTEVLEPVAAEMRPTPAAEEEVDEELEDVMGMFGGAPKIKVEGKKVKTYNYFNLRLQSFDPKLFDKTVYPEKCEKGKQVIVLTEEDQARIPAQYNYSDAPETEKLPLPLVEGGPKGIAICPPYWCMTNNLPLREEQLVLDADGDKTCPVCSGKVRKTDKEDQVAYSVIARNPQTKYPDLTKTGNFPCCYKVPRQSAELKARKTKADTTDDTYVLDAIRHPLPELRMGYVSDDLATKLRVTTNYAITAREGRLIGGETGIFRLGLGRPSKTLPLLFKGSPEIKTPAEAPENVKMCSFYRTWSVMGTGTSEEERIIDGINTAYKTGSMSILDELEYVTTFLRMAVWQVVDGQLVCGFWTGLIQPGERTILLVETDILAQVTRRAQKTGAKFQYEADIHKFLSKESIQYLTRVHTEACAINQPTFDDARKELVPKAEETLFTPREVLTQFEVIQDPFGRAQALFVPKKIVLPIRPTTFLEAMQGVPIRSGFSDIKEELPRGKTVRGILKNAQHPGYKIVASLQNTSGKVVELLLASGFRIPIVPEDASEEQPAKEVLETVMKGREETLALGEPNKEDIAKARDIAYRTEIIEFLLFSLSKDLQSGEYPKLKRALETKKEAAIEKELDAWMKAEAHWTPADTPSDFINKVRTPCGQFSKDACTKSSLCGWYKHKNKNVCKIRVRTIEKLDQNSVLTRLKKTLMENDKQRALVLDARLSPFFSTILYLEMPNEWITTVV